VSINSTGSLGPTTDPESQIRGDDVSGLGATPTGFPTPTQSNQGERGKPPPLGTYPATAWWHPIHQAASDVDQPRLLHAQIPFTDLVVGQRLAELG
jgi:hypothetical protein